MIIKLYNKKNKNKKILNLLFLLFYLSTYLSFISVYNPIVCSLSLSKYEPGPKYIILSNLRNFGFAAWHDLNTQNKKFLK
jgi:hypothetical protein